MFFTTHLLIGISIFLLLKDFFYGGNETIFLLLILFGSVFPDIDGRKSKIVQWTGIFGIIISFFSKHRGFFHSLFFVSLFTIAIKLFFGTYYAWGLFLGLTLHLFADGLTKQGINILYPFKEFKIKGMIRTGRWGEWIIQIVLLVFIVVKLI